MEKRAGSWFKGGASRVAASGAAARYCVGLHTTVEEEAVLDSLHRADTLLGVVLKKALEQVAEVD